MKKTEIKLGERVRVKIANEIEGIVQRVGVGTATVVAEDGVVLLTPLSAIEKIHGDETYSLEG